jgi:hypothetical protein
MRPDSWLVGFWVMFGSDGSIVFEVCWGQGGGHNVAHGFGTEAALVECFEGHFQHLVLRRSAECYRGLSWNGLLLFMMPTRGCRKICKYSLQVRLKYLDFLRCETLVVYIPHLV